MRRRFIKPGEKDRVMIRSGAFVDLNALAAETTNRGYTEVSLLGFIKHILFWWRKKT